MNNTISYELVKEADREAVKGLWQYCFTDDDQFVQWYFQHYYSPLNTLGAYKNGQLAGSTQMIPYTISLRGCALECGYIVGVDTAPEARRDGIARGMLYHCLETMRRRQQLIALLMPFEGSFYYPYQWSFCYFHHKYHWDINELKLQRGSYGEMRSVNPQVEIPLLNRIYETYLVNKNGYVIRKNDQWENLFAELKMENGYHYLLEADGKPEGYILYYFKDNCMMIKEMAYCHYKARQGLLNFIYSHRSHVARVEWSAPTDDGAEFLLCKTKDGATVFPFLMARIIDVANLLETLRFQGEKRQFIMAITDDLLPWNNGVFEFSIENGQGRVHQLPDASRYDFKMTIDALTQLVMGAIDGQSLLYQGRVEVCHDERYEQWVALWPKMNNYINEYY